MLLTIIANEFIAKSIRKADYISNVAFQDIEYFVENGEMQLNFVTRDSFDKTMEAIDKNLESTLNFFSNKKSPFLQCFSF